ncbi:hypothetical protein D3C86_1563570 [compost metagenome]
MQYARERWHAVGLAVEHIELVSELVDHHVVGVRRQRMVGIEPRAGRAHVLPGQDDGATLPRLAARFLFHAVHQPDLVLHGAPDQEFARIQHDAMPAAIPLDTELEDRHAGLHGHADHHLVGQRQVVRGRIFLAGDEQRGQLAQRGLVLGAVALHIGQGGHGTRPEVVRNGVVLKLAGA